MYPGQVFTANVDGIADMTSGGALAPSGVLPALAPPGKSRFAAVAMRSASRQLPYAEVSAAPPKSPTLASHTLLKCARRRAGAPSGLQHSRPEKRATAYGLTGDNEHSVARVVKRFGVLGSHSHMRLGHLEDEEIILLNERIVEKATFETGVAFGDKRRLDGTSILRCEAKFSEFVDLRPGRVADPDHNVRESCRGQIDNALTALADHLEAVIAA
jgi:hypothetical protein